MNEPQNSSNKPLLVLRVEGQLTEADRQKMMPGLETLAKTLNAAAAIEEPGATIRMESNPQALLDSSLALTESVSQLVKAIRIQTQVMQELIDALQEDGDDGEVSFATLDGR